MPLAEGRAMDLDKEIAAANQKVASDELVGYCIINGTTPSDSLVEYRSKSVGDFQITVRIQETLRALIVEKRMAALGMDPKVVNELNARLEVRTVKLSKTGEKEESGFLRVFFSAYLFMMMLFFLIVTSGQLLVRSVIEEKSNRIVEVLVSSCSATELMAGKVLGLSGLAFTQMGFWGLIGVVASFQFGVSIIDPGHALLLLVYFVLGYLFYAAVFIGAGSPLTTEQEAQQVTSYLVLLLIVPIVLALPAMKDPDALWLKVLTYIPFLTPTMMALRIPIQTPSLWEILSTILLMLASIYGAMVVAGRIFRIAVLATGKSPTLAEILRWARTG
jgi:ABC-2 type transport system permease protein